MTTFVYWMTGFAAFDLMLRIICLGMGFVPRRTRTSMVIDALVGLVVVVWGARLLA